MTNHLARLYALVFGVLLLLVLWAAIAARPWQPAAAPAQDPRVTALVAREQRLRLEEIVVRRVVARRWAVYRRQLARRRTQISAARRSAQLAAATPSVRVVTLPPLTITRTS